MRFEDEFGTSSTGVQDRFKPTLVERARKREVYPAGSGKWIVPGNEDLGDSYPHYTITEQDNWHHCTCRDHAGGQYRPVCSHVIAVLLWKEEHDSYEDGQEVGAAPTPGSEEGAALSSVAEEAPSSITPWDPAWGHPPLPGWVQEFRPHQLDAIEDVLDAFERGKKVVFLDAPTGSGKTLIAEAVRRKLGGRAVYTCTTKTLQDQFLRDYEYASVLKGRDNYETILAPFPDVTCGDCTNKGNDDCNWCPTVSECPYQVAKADALGNNLAVLNTAYALNAWNSPKPFFANRDLAIMDECDLLESALMGWVEVRISERKRKQHGLREPEVLDKRRVNQYGEKWREDWLRWVRDTVPVLSQALKKIDPHTTDVRSIREAKWLSNTLANLDILQGGLEFEDVKWVYDMDRHNAVVFKPVEVSRFGQEYLWKHADRFLLMSATVISGEEMANSLGLEEDEWEVVKVPSTFPVENRPIHAMFAGRVTNKTYNGVIDDLGRYLRAIVEHHSGERMLIHTVSYKLARDLHGYLKGIPHTRTYSNARERELILEWMRRTEGAVVLAPSFDRGVDLPGDYCTVQVVAKVPYPYLGDKQVSARLNTGYPGQVWFNAQTARTLVQMTGRGVRSDVDRCTTYIIDGQFLDFWKKNRRLFPEWWKEAVDFTGRVRSIVGL